MGAKMSIVNNWETIDPFFSPSEYNRFLIWLQNQIDLQNVEEVPVLSSFAGELFEEKWYKNLASGGIWRLVSPQEPFRGLWELVK
jgi:hypothetical protein